MLIAPVLTGGAVLNMGATVAVVAAAAELSVERVQGLYVKPGQRHRSEQRSNVLTDLGLVAALC
jgi:hypothetical protein